MKSKTRRWTGERTTVPGGGGMPKVGDPAPAFALTADDGRTVRLSDLRGRPVVLYFYPKDDTPGCTKEACSFRDAWSDVQASGAAVFGVSPDAAASHQKFRTKYRLPFPLLSDADHSVAEAYGAWGQKSMYGQEVRGDPPHDVRDRRAPERFTGSSRR